MVIVRHRRLNHRLAAIPATIPRISSTHTIFCCRFGCRAILIFAKDLEQNTLLAPDEGTATLGMGAGQALREALFRAAPEGSSRKLTPPAVGEHRIHHEATAGAALSAPLHDSRKPAGVCRLMGPDHPRSRVRRLKSAACPTLGGEPPAPPRWCDQIPTPAENQLYPCSEHDCAHPQSHDFRMLLAIEGVKSPKTRSCYEHHPPGRSKTMRTAVGRSIFPAGGIGRIPKPAAGEGEPTDRRTRQEQKENPPG
jgi:hypothetical protein